MKKKIKRIVGSMCEKKIMWIPDLTLNYGWLVMGGLQIRVVQSNQV